jgi:hypothetical protein
LSVDASISLISSKFLAGLVNSNVHHTIMLWESNYPM